MFGRKKRGIDANAPGSARLGADTPGDAGTGGAARHRGDLRLRLYPEQMLVEPLRSGVVTRELAPGLWETVAVDRPESVRPLPRGGPDDPDPVATAALFRVALGNTVEDEYTTTWFDIGDARVLHIGGEHPYMAAHVHVLDRYLEAPLADGALVSFPLPEVVLAHPIGGVHPAVGLVTLQEVTGRLVDDGQKAISRQVFWWRRAEPGQRPDLRPVDITMSEGGATIRGDEEFGLLVQRFA